MHHHKTLTDGRSLFTVAAKGEGAPATAGQLHPDRGGGQAAPPFGRQPSRDGPAGGAHRHPGPLEACQRLLGRTEERASHLVKGTLLEDTDRCLCYTNVR